MKNLLDLQRMLEDPFTNGRTWRPLLKQFDDIYDDMRRIQTTSEGDNFRVSCDLEELEDHYKLTLDVPGVDKDHIRIELRDNQLVVEGERSTDKSSKNEYRRHSERTWGKFQRVVSLPEGVKPESIEAAYKNGVLSIAIAKPAMSQTHRIPINEGRTGFLKGLLGGKESSSKDAEPISVRREQTV